MESEDAIDPGGAGIAIDPGNMDDAVLTQDQIDALANGLNIVGPDPVVTGTEVGNVDAATTPVGNGNVAVADPVIAAVPNASSSPSTTVVPVHNVTVNLTAKLSFL